MISNTSTTEPTKNLQKLPIFSALIIQRLFKKLKNINNLLGNSTSKTLRYWELCKVFGKRDGNEGVGSFLNWARIPELRWKIEALKPNLEIIEELRKK
jgi:hypothetical protein